MKLVTKIEGQVERDNDRNTHIVCILKNKALGRENGIISMHASKPKI